MSVQSMLSHDDDRYNEPDEDDGHAGDKISVTSLPRACGPTARGAQRAQSPGDASHDRADNIIEVHAGHYSLLEACRRGGPLTWSPMGRTASNLPNRQGWKLADDILRSGAVILPPRVTASPGCGTRLNVPCKPLTYSIHPSILSSKRHAHLRAPLQASHR
ncbi:Fc.00g036460.m01.CDS01 [Cosmosporella sp. VM-42]